MKRSLNFAILICGLALLAAFPVLAQDSQPVQDVRINKEPFRDLGKLVSKAVEKDRLDLTQPYKVAFEGKLVKYAVDGRETVGFDRNDFRWIAIPSEEAGNAQMVKLAKSAIEAVGDSGFFAYLNDLGFSKINGEFSQTDQKVKWDLKLKVISNERAKTLASGLDGLFRIGAMSLKGDDEKLIFDGMKANSAQDLVMVDFEIDKAAFQEMINKFITDAKK